MIGLKGLLWASTLCFLICRIIAEPIAPHYAFAKSSLTIKDVFKVKRAPSGQTSQPKAKPEMVFLSQPPGVQLAQMNNQYYYDQSAGSGATIYMCDSGADPGNAEFSQLTGSWRWVGPAWNDPSNPGTEEADPDGHGTMVLSKIAGLNFGIARNANIVVVRTNSGETDVADEVNMIKWIIEDWKKIRDSASVKVAIINMSYGLDDVDPDKFKATGQEATDYDNWRDALNEAVSEGLLPIVSSGNDDAEKVTAYPALMASKHNWNSGENDLTSPAVPQMLVVGATDNNGRYGPNSQVSDFVRIAAPGVSVTVAMKGRRPGKIDGTSFATGSVSGMAAYFAALPSFATMMGWTESTQWSKRVSDLINYLVDTASYARQANNENYPKALYNLECPPSLNARTLGDNLEHLLPIENRDAASACPANLAPQSTPIPTGVIGKTRTSAQLGYQPVNYGDLHDKNMVKQVSSVLLSPCPDTGSGTTTHCAEATQTISPIAYIEPENSELSGGDLQFIVKDSKYSSNAQRNGMIDVAANALYHALSYDEKNPSANKNCVKKRWEQGCGKRGRKRSGGEGFLGGGGATVPNAECEHGEQVVCTGPDNILVVVIDQAANMVANLDVDISFHQPGDSFVCGLIAGLVDAAVAVLPEGWAAEPEVATAMGTVEACCMDSDKCNITSVVTGFTGGGGD